VCDTQVRTRMRVNLMYTYTQKHTTHKHASCPNNQMLAMIADPVLGRNHFKMYSQRFLEAEKKGSKEDDREEEVEEEEEESGEESGEEENDDGGDDDDDDDEAETTGYVPSREDREGGPKTVPYVVPWYLEPGDW
jgi:phosphopantothenoylcysteine synthetase/decarboxylase